MNTYTRTFWRAAAIFGLALALVGGLMCSGWAAQAESTAALDPARPNAEATWKFWNEFNRASVAGHGLESLRDESGPVTLSAGDVTQILKDAIAGEHARVRAIAKLPLLGVDPDAAAYAGAVVRSRGELADYLQGCVHLIETKEEASGGRAVAAGAILGLLSHAGEPGWGPAWGAIGGAAEQIGEERQALLAGATALEQRGSRLNNDLAKVNGAQVAVRGKLAARYGREFRPRSTFVAEEAEARQEARVSTKVIERMLVGKSVGMGRSAWTFGPREQFVAMYVLSVTPRADGSSDYEVMTRVKVARTGVERDLHVRVRLVSAYTRVWMVGWELEA